MPSFPIPILMLSLTLGNVAIAASADFPARSASTAGSVRSTIAPPSAPPRLIASVQSGNAGKKLGDEMECLLEPHLVANVGSPVEGTLSHVLVDRGAQVAKGQIIARLNSSVEAANLDLRKAQEEFGKRKVERNVELFRKELISASEKDEIETQTRIAELEVKQQQQVLDQRAIRSPLDGVVVERYLAPGERVANEKILRIAQVNPLNVEVIAPVELFGSIKLGMAADVSLDPLLSGIYKAKVVVVDRVIDAASGTFGVRLELPNQSNKVPAGIKCRLRFKPA
jgi:membrane fusion protein (multidrug efflux system)